MSYVADELRKESVCLNRRIALSRLDGTIAECNEKTRKVRPEIGRDLVTNEKVLSDRVRLQSNSSGAFAWQCRRLRPPPRSCQGRTTSAGRT